MSLSRDRQKSSLKNYFNHPYNVAVGSTVCKSGHGTQTPRPSKRLISDPLKANYSNIQQTVSSLNRHTHFLFIIDCIKMRTADTVRRADNKLSTLYVWLLINYCITNVSFFAASVLRRTELLGWRIQMGGGGEAGRPPLLPLALAFFQQVAFSRIETFI